MSRVNTNDTFFKTTVTQPNALGSVSEFIRAILKNEPPKLSPEKILAKSEELAKKAINDILEKLKVRNDINQIEFGKKLETAFKIALEVHGKQSRYSGEPYIIHPIVVCHNLLDFVESPSPEAILVAILHDTIEDAGKNSEETIKTQTQIQEDIRRNFGERTLSLCLGVTKISKQSQKVNNVNKDITDLIDLLEKYVENGDIEILLIKLCDRLHNLQTLASHKKPHRVNKIITETIKVYYPIAYRLGMYGLRTGLSEALLRFLTSSEYMEKVGNPRKLVALERTLTEIDELLKNNTEKKEKAIEQLKTKLENFGELDISIQAINKSIYSIYRHLKECENIERTFALRVTVKGKTQEDKQRYLESIGYNIVSLLRKPGNPNYIELVNSDKPLVVNYYNKEREDGYKAVHTYLEINGILVEVQIMGEEEAKNASYGDPIGQSEKLKEGLFKNIFSDNENEDLVEKYKNLTKLLELGELPISLHRILYKSSAVSKLIEAIKRLLEGIIKKSRENL